MLWKFRCTNCSMTARIRLYSFIRDRAIRTRIAGEAQEKMRGYSIACVSCYTESTNQIENSYFIWLSKWRDATIA